MKIRPSIAAIATTVAVAFTCAALWYMHHVPGPAIMEAKPVPAVIRDHGIPEITDPPAVQELRRSLLEGELGKAKIPSVLESALQTPGPSREEAYLVLLLRRAESVPAIIDLLRTATEDARYRLLVMIQSTLRWPDFVPEFSRLLSDRTASEHIRGRAATGLASFGIKEAAPQIRDLLQTAREAQVRQMAAMALGALGDKDATSPLTKALQDASPHVRVRASMALGMLGSDIGLPAALEASRAEPFGLRLIAAEALARIGNQDALARLSELAEKDPSPAVRGEADRQLQIREIERLPNDRAAEALAKYASDDKCPRATWALDYLVAELPSEAKPYLRELASRRGKLQWRAVAALLRIDSGVHPVSLRNGGRHGPQ